MPSSSGKQHRMMEAIAHGAAPKSGHGPSKAVAEDFVAADKGKSFADDGKKIGNDGLGIEIKPSHKGLLHKDLGVPSGKPIPEAKLESAKNSENPAVRKRATFAENAKRWHDGQECGTCDRIHGDK